jgi:putative oxidoreductase
LAQEISKSTVGERGVLAARLVLASLFLLGGLNKFLDPTSTDGMLTNVGLEPETLFRIATALFEICAGAALVFGRFPAAIAGAALVAFTLLTNIVFHRFWELDGSIARLELSLFFKNIALCGGLAYVALREWERSRL